VAVLLNYSSIYLGDPVIPSNKDGRTLLRRDLVLSGVSHGKELYCLRIFGLSLVCQVNHHELKVGVLLKVLFIELPGFNLKEELFMKIVSGVEENENDLLMLTLSKVAARPNLRG
jgi:hypothetical protein